jgi:hypothetical protein
MLKKGISLRELGNAILSIYLLLSVSGCVSGEDDPKPDRPPDPQSAIRFFAQDTKSLVTGKSLASFSVYANVDDASGTVGRNGHRGFNDFEALNATRLGDQWSYGSVYWPNDTSIPLSFYAFSPLASSNLEEVYSNMATTGKDSAYIQYEVPPESDVENAQEDLLVCFVRQTAAQGTTVNLQFRHALSMVSFSACNPSADTTIVIDSISLTHLYNRGQLNLADFRANDVNWIPLPGAKRVDYTAAIPQAGVALEAGGYDATYKTLLSSSAPLLVLPQSFHAEANVALHDTYPMVRVVYHAYGPQGIVVPNGSVRYFPFAPDHPAGITSGPPVHTTTVGDFVFQAGKSYDIRLLFDKTTI